MPSVLVLPPERTPRRSWPVECLAIMPHPDDTEIICGGLLLHTRQAGLATAAVELTQGEAGTRGTVPERLQELTAAAKILRLTRREVLDLPDGRLDDDAATVDRVASLIRFYRPRIVVTTHWEDHHPDHEACFVICKKALWRANMGKFVDGQPRHQAAALLGGMNRMGMRAGLVLDVTGVFAKKMQAIRCFKSQLHQPVKPRGRGGNASANLPRTRIASADFLPMIEATHRFYGQQAGCEFAEPYALHGHLPVLVRNLRSVF